MDEAVEKVTYLLDHEDERAEIARAGQKRTLMDHTIFNRCQLIDERNSVKVVNHRVTVVGNW